ncbi:MAG: GGDEF domain-containing protein [Myxococcales bacterium]
MPEAAKILVAAFPELGRDRLAAALARDGLVSEVVSDTAAALRRAADVQLAIVGGDLAGDGLIEALKTAPRAGMLPLLAVSAGDAGERARLLDMGADDCLPVAFAEEELSARVRALLRLGGRFEELARRQRELEQLSREDGLTGLLNHRCIKERLAEEFRRAQRHGDALSLLMVDLDWFKTLNDRRGHPFGDRVLKRVAGLLTEAVRETDLCGRYGGEEFALLLPRTSLNGALTVAERVRSSVAATDFEGERLTLSVGVAGFPGSAGSAELLLRAADEALYASKREGRNRTQIYRDSRRAARPAGDLN